MKKRIAISTRVIDAIGYEEPRDALAQDWAKFFDSVGILPVLIPNTLASPESFIEELSIEGIILTGGNTVGLRGEPSPPADVKPERDRTENAVIQFALSRSLPILGVCRGMQMLNHFFGGKVTRNLAALNKLDDVHVSSDHDVRLVSENWQDLAGAKKIHVNSFHNDGLLKTDLAAELIPAAESSDGLLIEGFYHQEHPIMGIAWHLERPSPSAIFDHALIHLLFRT